MSSTALRRYHPVDPLIFNKPHDHQCSSSHAYQIHQEWLLSLRNTLQAILLTFLCGFGKLFCRAAVHKEKAKTWCQILTQDRSVIYAHFILNYICAWYIAIWTEESSQGIKHWTWSSHDEGILALTFLCDMKKTILISQKLDVLIIIVFVVTTTMVDLLSSIHFSNLWSSKGVVTNKKIYIQDEKFH